MPRFDNPADVKLPHLTKGKRPFFFENPDIDQIMTFVMEIITEMMVMRERQDTVERLLSSKGVVTSADIESYTPDVDANAERAAMRNALVKRILRIHAPEGRNDAEM